MHGISRFERRLEWYVASRTLGSFPQTLQEQNSEPPLNKQTFHSPQHQILDIMYREKNNPYYMLHGKVGSLNNDIPTVKHCNN